MTVLALAAAAGAAIAYFFDPTSGRRRRALARDRSAGFARQSLRRFGRVKRHAEAEAYGLSQKAQHLTEEPKPKPDDATLARKVETEIFRDADVPKGQLEERARKVQGVERVENLLHLPGTPAPTHVRH